MRGYYVSTLGCRRVNRHYQSVDTTALEGNLKFYSNGGVMRYTTKGMENITEELDNDLGHNIITTAKGKAYFDDSTRSYITGIPILKDEYGKNGSIAADARFLETKNNPEQIQYIISSKFTQIYKNENDTYESQYFKFLNYLKNGGKLYYADDAETITPKIKKRYIPENFDYYEKFDPFSYVEYYPTKFTKPLIAVNQTFHRNIIDRENKSGILISEPSFDKDNTIHGLITFGFPIANNKGRNKYGIEYRTDNEFHLVGYDEKDVIPLSNRILYPTIENVIINNLEYARLEYGIKTTTKEKPLLFFDIRLSFSLT